MTLLPEVWVWLARTGEGRLHPALPEALYEAGALARRLGLPLVGIAERLPDAAESDLLRAWRVGGLRLVPGPLPPHPSFPGGRTPLSTLGGVPRAFLWLADPQGAVTAPLFAAETGATLVTQATALTSDGAHLVVARPTLGGQYEALVTVALDSPLVVTLQPGAIGDVTPPAAAAGPAQALPVLGAMAAALAPASLPALHPPDAGNLSVSDADRIVAFGRGAFSREAVALVDRLAVLLGATVAGTRPAADEGWLPFAKQVGLTGAIVSPKLYVAVGISGAPYHMVGVKDPETLIAVNSDPEAPIFASAHLGIVGDLQHVLPALIARLERGQDIVPAAAALRKSGSPPGQPLAAAAPQPSPRTPR